MQTIELTAPSAWASYLINGDSSGLDEFDIENADRFLKLNCLGLPVSCEDAGFLWHHDARAIDPRGADCQTYTFLTIEPKEELEGI